MTDPMALMASLRLEDGRRWGEAAEDFQMADARAILTPGPDDPRQVFGTRPKGGSKSTDIGGLTDVWLVTQAQPGDVGYAAAADQEQARRLLERAAGFIRRTPGLDRQLEVQTNTIVNRVTGARVAAVAADAAGLEGILSPWLVVDELPNWPTTRNARAMWEAIVSSVPKVRGCRLLVIGHAGTAGSHWHRVYEACVASPRWLVHDVPGPLPWIDPQALVDQRAMLPDSAYQKRHLNQWSGDEDLLTTVDDLRACVVLDGPMPPRRGVRYAIGIDLGLRNDATAAVVMHAETMAGADPYGPVGAVREQEHHLQGLVAVGAMSRAEMIERLGGRLAVTEVQPVRVVLDRIETWKGSRSSTVQVSEVEEWLAQAHYSYGRAPVIADPWQMIGAAQRLRARGVEVEEYAFGSASIGRLANTLFQLLRDRALALPDDEGLLEELAAVRLVERTPGVMRLDHDAGGHDDRAIAIALAAQHLLQGPPPPRPAEMVEYRNGALIGGR